MSTRTLLQLNTRTHHAAAAGRVGSIDVAGSRRCIGWMGCVVAAACLLGCSKADDQADGKIVIEYWHQPMVTVIPGKEEFTKEVGDFERYLAKDFMRQHPNVVVRTQCLNWEDLPRKVPAAVIAGSPPDVLQDYLGRTSGYWYQGVLEPLEDVIAAERDDFKAEWLSKHTIDGHLHSVPLYGWSQILAINRAIWDQAGKGDLLPSADNPRWDFAQFETAMQAVAVPDKRFPLGLQVASEQGDYCILEFFWGMGANVYENRQYDRVALNSPAGVKALTRLADWHANGLIQPPITTISGNELNDMFWRGEVAMLPSSLALARTYENAKQAGRVKIEIDLMFTLPPFDPDVERNLAFGSSGLVMFKQSDPAKKKVVEEFVRFLSRADVIQDYCKAAHQMASRKSVKDIFAEQPELRGLKEQIDQCGIADMGLTSPKFYEIRKLMPPQLQAVFLKRKTPAEALADYERAAQAVLKR